MPDYLRPGVYIEEQPAPQTIEGVSTSTAGFVGLTQRGPIDGLPRLVTSFADFVRQYGGYLPEDPWGDRRYLAYAVEGFFNNGGRRVYIKRVVGANAARSSLTLNNGFVTRLLEDAPAELTARITVRLASLRGIDVGTNLTFQETIAGVDQTQTQTVIAYAPASQSITLDAPLTLRYTAGGCQVTVDGVAAPAGGSPRLTVEANSQGGWGDALRVSTADMDGAVGLADAAGVETTLRAVTLTFGAGGAPGAGATTVELSAASFALIADADEVEFANAAGLTERRIVTRGAGTAITWTEGLTRAATTARRRTALRAGTANPVLPVADVTGLQAGDLVRLSRGSIQVTAPIAAGGINAANRELTLTLAAASNMESFFAGDRLQLATAGRSTANRLDLRSTNNFYPNAVVEIDDGTTKTYGMITQIEGRSLILAANLGRNVPSGTAVRVVELSLSVEDGTNSERFDRLSLHPDAANFIETIVNLRSRLIRVTVIDSTTPAPFDLPRTLEGRPAPLENGDLGEVPTADDYRGTDNGPNQRSGIKALADIDEISIMAVPGISDAAVQAELILQCERLKDRFAVLDPALGSVMGTNDASDVIVQRNNHDTLYGAIYYPWLQIRDPLYPNDPEGRMVPPSGHVIGIYARVDQERGVQKAPANEVVRGILGLELKLGDGDQEILNPRHINVIRDFRQNGRGIRVWGARCLTEDNAWKYVPVRRLFIFIEESLEEGLQWVVFEPNGEDLWARVRRTISGFLQSLWKAGALAGITEEEAFFVRCDRTTMTEDDISNGRLIVLVGVAPLRPAEFVIVRISQKTLETTP